MNVQTILAAAQQYAPKVLDFLDTQGPKIQQHLPQILAAAKSANNALKALQGSSHPTATLAAVLTFVSELVRTAPDLAVLLEPVIMAQVQANANAAISLQSTAG